MSIRYNDFHHDPLAVVPGCPHPIPSGSIASRDDLTWPDSDCSWASHDHMVGHQPYGALDMKMVSRYLLSRGQQFWSVAGPTHGGEGSDIPPFSWSRTNVSQLPLHRDIDTFDFQPGIHHWGGNNINQITMLKDVL